jgi:hypothetical protein
MEEWNGRRSSKAIMGASLWALKNASDEEILQYSGFLKSKWTNEARLAAVESVFSKKAGGPHIFSVSG